jgi:hypothetical protein
MEAADLLTAYQTECHRNPSDCNLLVLTFMHLSAGGTVRKLATATQPQFPRKIAHFKQATGFQISSRTLKKLTFD